MASKENYVNINIKKTLKNAARKYYKINVKNCKKKV